jgi:hypothetical protein
MTTFGYLPSAGLTETIEWRTDVLITHNGIEQRLSLRQDPRIKQTGAFFVGSFGQRRQMNRRTKDNIQTVSLCPLWAYGSRIRQLTPTGGNRIYFDPRFMAISAGMRLVLINQRTTEIIEVEIDTVETDGATLTANVTGDVTKNYIVFPALFSIIDSYSNDLNQITGEVQISFSSWIEEPLVGENTAASLSTLAGFPVLTQKFLTKSTESLNYRYEIIDNEVGYREYRSRDLLVRYGGEKQFIIKRILQPEVMDYWRLFLNTVKGSWKPFLMSTQMSDMVPTATSAPADAFVRVDIGIYDLQEAFRYIEIQYSDKSVSRHRVMTVTDLGATSQLNISPALPNDAKVANIARISYLLKVRMSDTVQLRHTGFESILSFEVISTNEG